MSSIQLCSDTTESNELCEARGLYLKPLAKLNICVQLPTLKNPGKSISNWEVMEKLKKTIRPDEFTSLKVIKTTLEFIRFEGEVKNRTILRQVISRIDGITMKLTGFVDPLKVKSAEAKLVFPGRHDWDSFFRDAKNMNEMKPGERPDTIYFENLPSKWFSDGRGDNDKPSEQVLKQVFSSFGPVRRVDIVKSDDHCKDSNKLAGGIQTFSFNQDLTFQAYLQFKEYVGFVKAMDSLRGMKLLYKTSDGKAHVTAIKVDFDKSKHLSERNICKRELEREKLERLVKVKEEKLHQELIEEKLREEARQLQLEREREEKEAQQRQQEIRQKLKLKKLRKERLLKKKEQQEALKKQTLLKAQRKAEGVNLIKNLFQMAHEDEVRRRMKEIEEERRKQLELEEKQRAIDLQKKKEAEERKKEWLRQQEQSLREKLLLSLKAREEKRTEEIREKLRKELSGRKVLKSVLVSSTVKMPMMSSHHYGVDNYKNYHSHRHSLKSHSRTRDSPGLRRSYSPK